MYWALALLRATASLVSFCVYANYSASTLHNFTRYSSVISAFFQCLMTQAYHRPLLNYVFTKSSSRSSCATLRTKRKSNALSQCFGCQPLQPLEIEDRVSCAKAIFTTTDDDGGYEELIKPENSDRLEKLASMLNDSYSLSKEAAFTGKKVAVVLKWFEDNTGGLNNFTELINFWIKERERRGRR